MSGIATISSTLALQDKMTGTLRTITKAMSSTLSAMRTIKGVNLGAEFAKAAGDVRLAERAIESLESDMMRLGSTASGAGGGFTVLKGVAVNALSAIGNMALNGIRNLDDLADKSTRIKGSIAAINDGTQTTAELENKVFQAAQRSRVEYGLMADSVSKLNQQASDAFATNAEALAYAELLGKSFKVARTDTAAMEGATRQLVQALGSGVLRGDELNSVFEAAPNIIRDIADYLGVPIGQIREMAGEGQISADIVKNAMFAAADDINAKFNEMPMTIADIGTVAGNALYLAFEPALQMIGEGARIIYENWDTIAPIFYSVAAGITAAAVAFGIYTAVTWLSVAANWALVVSVLANPLTYILIAIIAVVTAIGLWIDKVGGIQIAWAMVVNAVLIAWDILKIGFFIGIFWVLDLWDKMKLGIATAAVGIADFMGNMKVAVLTILQNLVNGAIGLINNFIGLLNKIPGVSIDLVGEVTFGADAALQEEGERQARAAGLEAYQSEMMGNIAERQQQVTGMMADAASAATQRQAEITQMQADAEAKRAAEEDVGGAVPDAIPAELLTGTGSGKALKTKNVEPLISDEDLKMLVDISTAGFKVKYTQLTPTVAVNIANVNETADINEVINVIADSLEEMASSDLQEAII